MELAVVFIGIAVVSFLWDYTNRGEEIKKWKDLFNERDKSLKESEMNVAELMYLITTTRVDIAQGDAKREELEKKIKEQERTIKELEDTIKKLKAEEKKRDTTPRPQPPRPEPPKPAPIDGDTPHTDPFHYFFAWLEEDPEYKKTYKEIEKSPKDVCLFCKQPVDADDCLPLHSPLAIHRQCYENLYNDLSSISSEDEARRRFQETPGKVSLLYWTLAHWPTYPPDWEVRRKRILERAHYACKKCGESEETLHVHHKKAIEKGGLHTPNNLVCLCWHCHEKAHGRIFDPDHTETGKESAFSKKMRLLKQAMQEHKTVHFHYLDTYGVESDRDFTPQSWPNPENYHGAVCVRGYCHLRSAERTFIVHRISRLTINDE